MEGVGDLLLLLLLLLLCDTVVCLMWFCSGGGGSGGGGNGVDQALVQQICQMGFSSEQATFALQVKENAYNLNL